MSKLSDRIGAFTAIPNSVIRLMSSIGADGMALFVYLRYRTNSISEIAFPSYDTIRTETGLTRRRIAAAIRSLETSTVLERKKRFGQSTIYALKLPDLASSTAGGLTGNPVVQQSDSSNLAGGLSVVQQGHTNKIDLNKTQSKKNLGADAPSVPGEIPKPTRPLTERQRVLMQMEKDFSKYACLPLPRRITEREKKAAGTQWWGPLWNIYELVERHPEQADSLMRDAIKKMRTDKLVISAPQSIEKVARSIFAERRAKQRGANVEAIGPRQTAPLY